MHQSWRLGAICLGDERCRFLVWAPTPDQIELHIHEPDERTIELSAFGDGYFHAEVDNLPTGALYSYRINGNDRPDPASRWQPEGVHGPSAVVDPGAFQWTDGEWSGAHQADLVFYELHVGTFTPEGTFDAIIPRIAELRDLGITAIELMPVGQFPGARNWGYDGVQVWAVQHSYGGPEGLRRLVDACHARGIAVFLDVIYNHVGPEGNYLGEYAPYFTDVYLTPWGAGINYDQPESDNVRRYFIQHALHWLDEYHIDGFRLDAIHAIRDINPRPFLRDLTDAIHARASELGRRVQVIAESNMNDPRVVNPGVVGGYGMDAEWSDDFHHALHAFVTGERTGYYRDFGRFEDVVRAYRHGFVYTGQHSWFRGRSHGDVPRLYRGENFVVFSQNHDQVGNRAVGDRLSAMVPFEVQKTLAGLVILSPYLPLLFMGQEWGETAPFPFFIDHGDPDLVEAVRQGRQREFARFDWPGEVADPADPKTLERAKLQWHVCAEPKQAALRAFHKELLRLRREHPVLRTLDMASMDTIAYPERRTFVARRELGIDEVLVVYCFHPAGATIDVETTPGTWRALLDSAGVDWHGPGTTRPAELVSDGWLSIAMAPYGCTVFELTRPA
jgi:maltooligosyltrehalose trehalohydrolase